MDDPSKTLMKEKLSETVADIPEIRPTYLHRIAESYSAIGLMNILQKYPELVQPMLEQVDLTGSTPLHQAIKRKNVDIAKCLIRCGADYKKQNKREETPIYLAVLNGQIDILEEIFLLCKFSFDLKHLYVSLSMFNRALEQIFFSGFFVV